MKTFYDHQASARFHSLKLFLLFVVSVVGIAAAATVAVEYLLDLYRFLVDDVIGSGRDDTRSDVWSLHTFLIVGSMTTTTIVITSVYEFVRLVSGGGDRIAAQLGGIPLTARDRTGTRILNIVNEIAIAARIQTPRIYVLPQESGINAFAAGYDKDDAVIGITQGALSHLNREQLQGMMAHEFSHICNNDMRLNIQTTAVLRGILLFDVLGRRILWSLEHALLGDHTDSSARLLLLLYLPYYAAIIFVGVLLMLVGLAGSTSAGALQAAMNRQREFLADATAVEYTRNQTAVAGALKLIARHPDGSRITHPRTRQFSHLFFGSAVRHIVKTLQTHPTLTARIRRLEPEWNGLFLPQRKPVRKAGPVASSVTAPGASRPVEKLKLLAPLCGAGSPLADEARALMPEHCRESISGPIGAIAVLCALLLDANERRRAIQVRELHQFDGPIAQHADALRADIDTLDEAAECVLLDSAIAHLETEHAPLAEIVSHCAQISAGEEDFTDAMAWAVAQVARRVRQDAGELPIDQPQFDALEQVVPQCEVVLSALARASTDNGPMSEYTFRRAAVLLPDHVRFRDAAECGLSDVDIAMNVLATLTDEARDKFLGACTACVDSDRIANRNEAALIRGIFARLGQPIPRLIPGQAVRPSA